VIAAVYQCWDSNCLTTSAATMSISYNVNPGAEDTLGSGSEYLLNSSSSPRATNMTDPTRGDSYTPIGGRFKP